MLQPSLRRTYTHGLFTPLKPVSLGKMDTCEIVSPPLSVLLHRQSKAHFHNLLCFDLYDLSRRSSGLVSRPLCDLSLSPCITGRKACQPIRPRSKTCQERKKGVIITKSSLLAKYTKKKSRSDIRLLIFKKKNCIHHSNPPPKIRLNLYFLDQQLFY